MKPYALLLFVPFLAGCDPLSAIEGKSPGREHVERLALVSLPAAPAVEAIQAVVCVETFRVNRCAGGQATDWWSGEILP